jgi:hypothetical protein
MKLIGKLRASFTSLELKNKIPYLLEVTVSSHDYMTRGFTSPIEIYQFTIYKGTTFKISTSWEKSLEVEIKKITPEGIMIKTNKTLVDYKKTSSGEGKKEFLIPFNQLLELVTPTTDKFSYYNFEITDKN